MKTDTQGVNLEGLRSAGHRLDDIRAAQVEVAARPMYSGTPSMPEVLRRLGELGFEVTGMLRNATIDPPTFGL